jgi:hypothetical protein
MERGLTSGGVKQNCEKCVPWPSTPAVCVATTGASARAALHKEPASAVLRQKRDPRAVPVRENAVPRGCIGRQRRVVKDAKRGARTMWKDTRCTVSGRCCSAPPAAGVACRVGLRCKLAEGHRVQEEQRELRRLCFAQDATTRQGTSAGHASSGSGSVCAAMAKPCAPGSTAACARP